MQWATAHLTVFHCYQHAADNCFRSILHSCWSSTCFSIPRAHFSCSPASAVNSTETATTAACLQLLMINTVQLLLTGFSIAAADFNFISAASSASAVITTQTAATACAGTARTGAAAEGRPSPEAEFPSTKRGRKRAGPDSWEAGEDDSPRSGTPPSRRGRSRGTAAGLGSSTPTRRCQTTTKSVFEKLFQNILDTGNMLINVWSMANLVNALQL